MAKKKQTEQERTTIAKARMIESMRKCLGIVTQAAEMAGIDRRTHQYWMKEDEEYKEAIQSVDEIVCDFVESQMLKSIKKGSDRMMIHWSNNRMRHKGFGEKLDITSDGEKMNTGLQITFKDFSDKGDSEE